MVCSNMVAQSAPCSVHMRQVLPRPQSTASLLTQAPLRQVVAAHRPARLRHCTLTCSAGPAVADPPSSSAQSAAVDDGALLDCVVVGGGISGLVTAQVGTCHPLSASMW
jgi:hypothetical protein